MGAFKDVLIIITIIFIIKFGTGIINYYYNFYHIYKYLNYEQKVEYFKNINITKYFEIIKDKSIQIRTISNYIIKTSIKITYIWLLFLLSIYKTINSTNSELDENLISLDIIEYIDDNIVNTNVLDNNINEIINSESSSEKDEIFKPEIKIEKYESDSEELIEEYVIVENKNSEEPIELDVNEIEFGEILEIFTRDSNNNQDNKQEEIKTTNRLVAKKKKLVIYN